MPLGSTHHIGLTLRDVKAAESTFYAPVLGFLGYEKVEDTPEFTLWWSPGLQIGVNLWQAKAALAARSHERYAPGLHHLAFAAESRAQVDALHQLLREIGATVLDAPAEYEYTPGYYAVFFTDPDGLKLELVHMPPLA
jgi:catechol 2,3-dioxygenase-like lactoylglutathione lyase family enzyme